MVEIGKKDIVDRNALSMEPFNRNCSFRALNLSYLPEMTDSVIGDLFDELFPSQANPPKHDFWIRRHDPCSGVYQERKTPQHDRHIQRRKRRREAHHQAGDSHTSATAGCFLPHRRGFRRCLWNPSNPYGSNMVLDILS